MKNIVAYSLIGALFLGLLTFINPTPVHSATAKMYLSPASKTVNVGVKFTVAVRIDSGSVKVNAVQANLSYPASKLDFVSISAGGTAFPAALEESGGAGSVKIARMLPADSVKGDKLVVSVTFKAKNEGSASVSYIAGSYIVRSSDNQEEPSTKSPGTYTIKSSTSTQPPPPSDGSTTTPGGTGSTTSSTGTASTAKKDTTAPKITDLKVVGIGFEKATVTWKTNEAADSTVEYGISKKLGLVVYSKKKVKTHKLSLSSKMLTEGTRFYYTVGSKDAAGNVAKSKLTSFKTKGYNAKIKVLDLSGKPVEGAKVTLVPDFDLTVTDEFGFALFTDIAPGKHSVNVEVDGQTVAETITVKRTKNPAEVQNFTIKIAALATTKGFQLPDLNTVIVIGILFAASLALFWILKFRMFSLQKVGGGSAQKGKEPEEPMKSEDTGSQESKDSELPSLAPGSLEPKGSKSEPKMEVFKPKKE